MAIEIIASRKDERTTADGYLVATSQLYRFGGNVRPHFSVTGGLWQSRRWYLNGQDDRLHECGRANERIAKAFPFLAPVIAVHLADDDGVPMHAVANGWYWYSDYDGKGTHLYPHDSTYSLTPHERAARYLRIAPSELPAGLDREAFEAFCETLRPRWKTDADRALAIIKKEN